MTIQQILQSAADHHRAGRLPQAERLYRAVLAEQPNHPDALHLLGIIANQTGHHKDACELITKAIAQRPTAEFYFNLAGTLNPLGEYPRAIEALRQSIALKPTWAAPQGNLGALLQTTGQLPEAILCFQKAITLEPKNPNFHYNLGNALSASGNLAEAANAFTAAMRLDPRNTDAMNNLGSTLYSMGRFPEAEQSIRQALTIRPAFPAALNNLGNILIALSRFEEAADVFRQALVIDSNMPMVHNNLGNVLCGLGRFDESIAAYRQAIAMNPNWPEVHNNLSIALRASGDFDGAIAEAEQTLLQQPGFHLALENLAQGYQAKGDNDRALEILGRLVAEHPNDDRSLNTYANVLRGVGRLDEALAAYKSAADLDPGNFLPASNYLFALQFHSDDPGSILAEHRKWNDRFVTPFASEIRPFQNDRTPNRRLRVGYLSPDFRIHCQSLFTRAVFPHHDREQFEIYCYSAAVHPDEVTAAIRPHADVWRHVPFLSDAAISDLVRADKIDILVDLTMHMGHCRPLIHARKPAPVQVTWLAYPGTTGMSTMDYRLTDPYLDPPGFESRYTEQSIRLPDTFWCYTPHGMAAENAVALPDPGELPALKNGFLTFGCLNDFSKVNAPTLQRWGRLMQSVPQSRLHLLAPQARQREIVLEQLREVGVSSDRIQYIDRQARPVYLAKYCRIDLCLDTLPYNGHTTSLDAFWMGVPVLTQVGRTVVGRAGFSQLTNLQLPNFAAESDEQFFSLGKRWASDLPALAEIRRTLRERMTASPLMNGKKFARNMESAFRRLWNQWI
jgi:protein O-GlcNAc transferase